MGATLPWLASTPSLAIQLLVSRVSQPVSVLPSNRGLQLVQPKGPGPPLTGVDPPSAAGAAPPSGPLGAPPAPPLAPPVAEPPVPTDPPVAVMPPIPWGVVPPVALPPVALPPVSSSPAPPVSSVALIPPGGMPQARRRQPTMVQRGR